MLELFTYRDIPRSEEELSVKVGFLDDVHICDPGLTFGATGHTHQSPVLQHFTSNSTCTNLQNHNEGFNLESVKIIYFVGEIRY